MLVLAVVMPDASISWFALLLYPDVQLLSPAEVISCFHGS